MRHGRRLRRCRPWSAQAQGGCTVGEIINNMHIQTRRLDNQIAVVNLQGEMDVYSTPSAKETILELINAGYHHLVVNLQQADYLDSTALGMLVGALKRVREKGGDLRLVAPTARIRRLLEITRLVNVFPIDATEQDATSNLNNEGKESR